MHNYLYILKFCPKIKAKYGTSISVQKILLANEAMRAGLLSILNQVQGEIKLEFHIKMPATWSKEKRDRMNYKPHKSAPLLIDLIRIVTETLFPEGSNIYEIKAAKYWNINDEIHITL